jgi:CHAT domain-containing protein
VLQADLGDWQAADASFERALVPLRKQLGATHPQTLSVRTNRALARWGARPGPEAEAEYAEVVTALRGALGADAPGTAAAVRNLARMRFELGRAAEAEALLAEALAAQAKTLGANHPDLAPTRIEQARLLAQRGALDAAAAEVDRAIAALVEARGDEHRTVVRARTLRARIAVAQGDSDTALRQALEASSALARYTRHTFGALSDRQRSLLAGDAQDVIGALLSVESAPPRSVFTALLPHRDAVLRSIAAGHAGAGGDPQLAELRRRYVAAAIGTSPDAAKRAGELAARIDALEARAAAGATLPDRNPEEVLERACARLPEDAALIAFTAYDRTAPGAFAAPEPALAALVVRGGGCQVARAALPRGADIEAAAESFARSMRDERADDAAARRSLADALLAPLAPAAGDARRWLVIPDGALWGVPLGVLPDPQAGNKYLFERVTIGYLTSAYELAEGGDGGAFDPGSLRSLLVGAPDFGADTGGPTVLTDAGPCQMAPFEPLPATSSEIEDIGSLVGTPTVLVGGRATKPGLAEALGGKPWLVHFATHAYFAGQGGCSGGTAADWRGGEERIAPNPLLLSGIALAGANAPARVGSDEGTGILTAYEVAGLDLSSARLVVLSACDTGTGLRQRGQEVQGLRWGFRAAGAKALVTSLWRSNDVATRSLMRAFYQALVSDDIEDDVFRGAEALRRAQLAQVKSERLIGLQRPLTWANFVFSGVL